MKSSKKIIAEIKLGEDFSLNLHAKDMNELVEKIVDWQLWENNNECLPKKYLKNWYFYKTKTTKKTPTKKIKSKTHGKV